ncbi:MAG TPA: hypothetical protein VGL44_10600 [Gaiellales bacterium]
MRPARPRYRARGALFAALTVGLLGIAWAAASASVWIIAGAAAAIGLWMADLARRDLGPRR